MNITLTTNKKAWDGVIQDIIKACYLITDDKAEMIQIPLTVDGIKQFALIVIKDTE